MTSPVIRVHGLRKRFRRADRTFAHAVDGVSLDVRRGEFLVLLGPSGCGKTTLLRSIAGLETPDEGSVEVDGRVVFDAASRIEVPPEKRGLSMMFQSYALWPHLTVRDNVAYPLRNRRVGRRDVATRVAEVLDLVGIGELAGQHPSDMSGGQQQRVALARALVARDDVVLFDEPLSNVDAKVRERLRAELVAMQRRLGFSAVYVTHDQTEAMELATRIAVMRAGRVEQLGPPREIYASPATRYVATFVGVANEIEGTVTSDGALDTPVGVLRGSPVEGLTPGDAAVAVWRPECGRLTDTEPDGNRWPATAQVSLFAGAHTEHVLRTATGDCRVWTFDRRTDLDPDRKVWVCVDPADLRILPA
ncbi:ABC transporter ATP-binding protein [Virgisporangium ochraceum]|nr:ABC transporter ATP-binding protein [Virgisporangium ochraceum]